MSNKRRMSLGLLLPTSAHKGTPKFEKILEMSTIAEESGFESLWVGDSVLRARIEPLTSLAAVAAKTQKVKLGTSTLLLPIRNPILSAQMLVTLDHISNGRIILGVAPGGEDAKKEFKVCNVPFEKRGARMDEYITILRKLWTENNIVFSGKFYNLSDITLDPKPVQEEGPKIWIGGSSERALMRVAEIGNGWIPFDLSPEEYEKNWTTITELANRKDRKIKNIHPSVYLYTNLKPEEEGKKSDEGFYHGGIHESTLSTHGRKQVYTSTNELLKKFDKYAQIGVRTIILRFAARDPMGQLIAAVKNILPSI